MRVIIKDIDFRLQNTLLSLQDKRSIIICFRGSVIDLEIDSDELAREILKKHCDIDLQ